MCAASCVLHWRNGPNARAAALRRFRAAHSRRDAESPVSSDPWYTDPRDSPLDRRPGRGERSGSRVAGRLDSRVPTTREIRKTHFVFEVPTYRNSYKIYAVISNEVAQVRLQRPTTNEGVPKAVGTFFPYHRAPLSYAKPPFRFRVVVSPLPVPSRSAPEPPPPCFARAGRAAAVIWPLLLNHRVRRGSSSISQSSSSPSGSDQSPSSSIPCSADM